VTRAGRRRSGLRSLPPRRSTDLCQYEGFQDAIVLVPREGEEVLVISFWDTEENLRGAEATPAPHRTSAAREALGPQTKRDVRVYEVAFRAKARD